MGMKCQYFSSDVKLLEKKTIVAIEYFEKCCKFLDYCGC